MAKKDKAAKTNSKSKQDGKGGKKDGVSKKKSDKSASLTGAEKLPEQTLNQQGAGDSTPAVEAKPGSFSSQKDGGGETTAGRGSIKVASPPEWDSDAVRNATLIGDGFSSCIVLVMEDSPDLSKYGEYLLCAVETGVRRNFSCISGAQTAERVKRYLESQGQWTPAEDHSHWEKQELFAEAIKHTLLGIKEHVATEIDADHQRKEMELAGARSKDLIRYVPPLSIPVPTSGGTDTLGAGGTDGIREPPPAPPPTGSYGVNRSSPEPPAGTNQPGLKKSLKGKETSDEKLQGSTKMGVKTRMRKRGEVPMPEFEVIEDAPPAGPRSYVLLQGFYNPRLIDELRKIGVKVDGILLMTDAKVNRYNFSIIDVEDSIPGTFRPKNVLPQYLKAMEKLSQNPETRNSEVAQFWTKLSEMYNSAGTDSPFHDIALMNFPLPETKRINLDTTEGLTYYISKVFDEASKRVYEMLVLAGWFQEFSSAAEVTKLQPLEPTLPREIYDQIMAQIPSECISVPIILEAVVQQVAHSFEKEAGNEVPEPCYENDTTAGIITGKSSFGSTNWGLVAPQKEENASSAVVSLADKDEGDDKRSYFPGDGSRLSSPLFRAPMYIKSGDYASIRSCHLNESLAAKIASCQLSGDMRNIQGFLWQKVPEFNRGLYMKLLGNLNHFLYFMPPDMIQLEDMFYILHLLMCAGVELHLQKQAAESKSTEEKTKPDSIINQDGVYLHNRPDNPKFPGTNLDTDHNYLAISQKTGSHYVISPNSNQELTVASLGNSPGSNPGGQNPDSKTILANFMKEVEQGKLANLPSETEETLHAGGGGEQTKKKKKRGKGQKRPPEQVDLNKAARVTAVGAIETAAKYAKSQNETTNKAESEILEKRKNNSKKEKEKEVEAESVTVMDTQERKPSRPESVKGSEVGEVAGSEHEGGCDPKRKSRPWGEAKSGGTDPKPEKKGVGTLFEKGDPLGATQTSPSQNASVIGGSVPRKGSDSSVKKLGFASMNYPTGETKRFIACEEQWFEDINDTSVIQALLECPALLAINESGAMDLSKWVEKYLLSAGIEVGLEEGVLLGDIKSWNYVEELVPIQTVQMLNEACQEYLSMQRMYCPFYDTILFIFSNPMPKELTAETQFYCRLNTLPGLQHFLEYTMDDQSVLKWIERLDSSKRVEEGDQTSINTILSIIPEEQWLLEPSIKYQILLDNHRSVGSLSEGGGNKGVFYGKIMGSYTGVNKDRGNSKLMSGRESETPAVLPSPEPDLMTPEPPPLVEAAPDGRAGSMEIESEIPKTPTSTSKGTMSVKGSSKAKSEKSEKKSEKRARVSAGEEVIPAPVVGDSSAPTTAGKNSQESAAVSERKSSPVPEEMISMVKSKEELVKANLNFACYDLGKRMAVVGNDTFFLFPQDGTVIRYDISTIEPEYRMMQLTVTKNGHETFFYPYYIPHDFDLSSEDYVVCPYFHMVLSNGTILAFQDLRVEEAAPYLKIALNKRQQAQSQLFSFERVLFGKEVEKKLNEVATAESAAEEERVASGGSRGSESRLSEGGKKKRSKDSGGSGGGGSGKKGVADKTDVNPPEDGDNGAGKKGKKGAGKEKKGKKEKGDKSPEVEKKDKKEKKGKKEKDKKGKGNKPEAGEGDNEEENPTGLSNPDTTSGEMGEGGDGETADEALTPAPPPSSEVEEGVEGATEEGGEWMYPSSENSDDEAETQKRKLFFAPPWDDAVQVIQPMAHAFTATLPSGLMITVEDVPGPPLLRTVKQYYVGHGSAKSRIEGSRYYTMDGSVIKFLLNGCIQILTARGVTTNIDELAANSRRDTDNISSAFGLASIVKIFNGEVILPNGHLWQVVNGKKVSKTPIYVFTTGPLAGGEVFRRRQDGVVYLHRYDGTVITHYPDGTRFTTRMVVLEKNPPRSIVSIGPGTVDSKTGAEVPISTSNDALPKKSREKVTPKTSVVNPPAKNSIENATGKPVGKSFSKKSTGKVDVVEETPPELVEEPHEDEEFSDWVFVGLKYMIEHPNYSTVLFNTLSGNVHLKLPQGEWIRVFADGNVRISTEDQYSLDVDKDRALLSYPPCVKGRQAMPNLTTVRLWHAAPPGPPPKEIPVIPVNSGIVNILLPEPAEPSQVESQVPLDQQAEPSEKERHNKKKSINKHHSKNLHPKVKQREGKSKKVTRAGSLANSHNNSKKELSTAATAGHEEVLKTEVPRKKSVSGKEETPGPGLERPVESRTSGIQAPAEDKSKPVLRTEGGSLTDFLLFKDETTFCKSVDSWDNRFLMNIYGGAVVDKIEKPDVCADMSTQQLIETLSEHSHLPKEFISGILKNTSSENLGAAAKRLQAIRRSYSDSCRGALPSTKLFVVKRDLTAFQYLQKREVEEVVSKAYASRDSMVIVDPVPKRQPRKFVTIMRPVEEVEQPHGMWTRPYIEPMFRPRTATNKHLRIATPNDLRWFGYILNASHLKRPKFVEDPKEKYKEKRLAEMAAMSESQQETVTEQGSKVKPGESAGSGDILGLGSEMGPAGDDVGEPLGTSEEEEEGEVDEGYSGEGEEEETSGEEEKIRKRSDAEPPKANLEEDKKKKSKKKEKETGKKGKGKDKKSKGAKDSLLNFTNEEEEEEEEDDGSQYEIDPITGVLVRKSRTPRTSHKSDLQNIEPEVDDYPLGIEDLQGIYEIERERRSGPQLPKIAVKPHALPCNTKKAIVVRAFVEIPKVDENMQRALLAASMSYAETCKTEAAIFKTYKTEDPRSVEEKRKQVEYKQQMIEQNIDEMHMLEQKPGPVLKFHF